MLVSGGAATVEVKELQVRGYAWLNANPLRHIAIKVHSVKEFPTPTPTLGNEPLGDEAKPSSCLWVGRKDYFLDRVAERGRVRFWVNLASFPLGPLFPFHHFKVQYVHFSSAQPPLCGGKLHVSVPETGFKLQTTVLMCCWFLPPVQILGPVVSLKVRRGDSFVFWSPTKWLILW